MRQGVVGKWRGTAAQADDPGAERVGQLCDNIRDADDETAWDDTRQEFEDIDVGR